MKTSRAEEADAREICRSSNVLPLQWCDGAVKKAMHSFPVKCEESFSQAHLASMSLSMKTGCASHTLKLTKASEDSQEKKRKKKGFKGTHH
ncbi:hypothetical protein TNCV_1891771 [Trichonephila clavipes]|nr:hypothetical protein TNCV_1891771 [Trichonephila clavipes]